MLGIYLGLSLVTPGKGGISIFDLRVNGQPLFVNSQQMKVTDHAN